MKTHTTSQIAHDLANEASRWVGMSLYDNASDFIRALVAALDLPAYVSPCEVLLHIADLCDGEYERNRNRRSA